MEALVDGPWRSAPAALLMMLGAAMAVRGLRMWFAPRHGQLRRSLSRVEAFRWSMFGLACFGVGAAWQWQQLWLLVIALVIAGEEILETSIVIFALRRDRTVRAEEAADRAPGEAGAAGAERMPGAR